VDYRLHYGQFWIEVGVSPSLRIINVDITLWSASIVTGVSVHTLALPTDIVVLRFPLTFGTTKQYWFWLVYWCNGKGRAESAKQIELWYLHFVCLLQSFFNFKLAKACQPFQLNDFARVAHECVALRRFFDHIFMICVKTFRSFQAEYKFE